MLRRLALTFALSASLACAKKAPDPLAAHRATCEQLSKAGHLKKGLTVGDCAAQLKATADASDPKLRAGEILDRLAALTARGRGSADPGNQLAVRDAIEALQRLGKPSAQPALARMEASADPDFRIAVAKALIATCSDQCGSGDYSCIVPALLEGVSADKPADVRREAEKGLMRCTGEPLGDDPAAWKKWWSERKARASTAAR